MENQFIIGSDNKIHEPNECMSEKELLIEMILELKRIDQKCDDIARKIVIWSNWIIKADEGSQETSSAVLCDKDSCCQGAEYGLQ